MKRILIPSLGPVQWKALLADPQMHWKRERSALELAVSWELAQATPNDSGMPREVKAVIDTALPLKDAELLMGMPEHKVTLNTSRAPSQTDFWALLRCSSGLISLSIEAKAGEPFAPQRPVAIQAAAFYIARPVHNVRVLESGHHFN